MQASGGGGGPVLRRDDTTAKGDSALCSSFSWPPMMESRGAPWRQPRGTTTALLPAPPFPAGTPPLIAT